MLRLPDKEKGRKRGRKGGDGEKGKKNEGRQANRSFTEEKKSLRTNGPNREQRKWGMI